MKSIQLDARSTFKDTAGSLGDGSAKLTVPVKHTEDLQPVGYIIDQNGILIFHVVKISDSHSRYKSGFQVGQV